MRSRQLLHPIGLCIDSDHGLVFVCDGARFSALFRVVCYQIDGTFVNEFLGHECFVEPSGGLALWQDRLFVANQSSVGVLALKFDSDYLPSHTDAASSSTASSSKTSE
jgi:hypothetical protein